MDLLMQPLGNDPRKSVVREPVITKVRVGSVY